MKYKEGNPLFTDGVDVFPLWEAPSFDGKTLAGFGQNVHGQYYFRCTDPGCDHSCAPAGADVWHSREKGEMIWPADAALVEFEKGVDFEPEEFEPEEDV